MSKQNGIDCYSSIMMKAMAAMSSAFMTVVLVISTMVLTLTFALRLNK